MAFPAAYAPVPSIASAPSPEIPCSAVTSPEDLQAALAWRVGGLFGILLVSSIGFAVPFLFRKDSQKSGIFVFRAFAAGVVLATGLVHVLPDATATLSDPCLGLPEDLPWTAVFATFAALLAFTFEYYMREGLLSRIGRISASKTAQAPLCGPGDLECKDCTLDCGSKCSADCEECALGCGATTACRGTGSSCNLDCLDCELGPQCQAGTDACTVTSACTTVACTSAAACTTSTCPTAACTTSTCPAAACTTAACRVMSACPSAACTTSACPSARLCPDAACTKVIFCDTACNDTACTEASCSEIQCHAVECNSTVCTVGGRKDAACTVPEFFPSACLDCCEDPAPFPMTGVRGRDFKAGIVCDAKCVECVGDAGSPTAQATVKGAALKGAALKGAAVKGAAMKDAKARGAARGAGKGGGASPPPSDEAGLVSGASKGVGVSPYSSDEAGLMSGDSDRDRLLSYRASALTLEAGIVFHSVFVGIALGTSHDLQYIKGLAVALCFHQGFEGLSVGSALVKAQLKLLKVVILGVTFVLTTPVGICIGLALGSTYNPSSRVALGIEGAFGAASAGILLYAALVDLIHPTFDPSDPSTPKHKGVIGLGFLAMFLGAGCMCVLALWA